MDVSPRLAAKWSGVRFSTLRMLTLFGCKWNMYRTTSETTSFSRSWDERNWLTRELRLWLRRLVHCVASFRVCGGAHRFMQRIIAAFVFNPNIGVMGYQLFQTIETSFQRCTMARSSTIEKRESIGLDWASAFLRSPATILMIRIGFQLEQDLTNSWMLQWNGVEQSCTTIDIHA